MIFKYETEELQTPKKFKRKRISLLIDTMINSMVDNAMIKITKIINEGKVEYIKVLYFTSVVHYFKEEKINRFIAEFFLLKLKEKLKSADWVFESVKIIPRVSVCFNENFVEEKKSSVEGQTLFSDFRLEFKIGPASDYPSLMQETFNLEESKNTLLEELGL